MKTLFLFLVSACSLSAQLAITKPFFTAATLKPVVAGGVACSGAFGSGATERFESGEGTFCTTTWTETDTGGLLSTFATDQFVTGTHSMKYAAAGTTTDAFITTTISDDDCSLRFYFRQSGYSSVAAGTVVSILEIDSASPPTTAALRLQIRRNADSSVQLRIIGTTTVNSQVLSADTWYRVEVRAVRNSTSGVRVFSVGGAEVGSEVTVTIGNEALTYVHMGLTPADNNPANTYDLWWDNITFSAAGDYPIGADE